MKPSSKLNWLEATQPFIFFFPSSSPLPIVLGTWALVPRCFWDHSTIRETGLEMPTTVTESQALDILLQHGTSEKKKNTHTKPSQGSADVPGSSRRCTVWYSRQILESRSHWGREKPQEPPPTWSKGRLFLDHAAGSYLWAGQQRVQTESGRKPDAIRGVNTFKSCL